jgi:hypothetical protein
MTERFGIVWGRAARRVEALDPAALSGDMESDQVLPVESGRTPALRLNSDTGRRVPPERLTECAGNDAKLAALKEETARGLDLFARHPRRFLDLYFAFLGAQVEAQRVELQERLAWSGGLFGHRDWVFSALRPLPRAALADFDGRPRLVQPVADFGFWTGHEAVFVAIRGAGERHQPAAAGPGRPIRTVQVTPAEMDSPESLFARDRWGGAFVSFWEGEAWPAGPFRPRGLEGLTVPESLER